MNFSVAHDDTIGYYHKNLNLSAGRGQAENWLGVGQVAIDGDAKATKWRSPWALSANGNASG